MGVTIQFNKKKQKMKVFCEAGLVRSSLLHHSHKKREDSLNFDINLKFRGWPERLCIKLRNFDSIRTIIDCFICYIMKI